MKWDVFKNGSGIQDSSAAAQLFQCADDDLADCLLKVDPKITSRNIDTVLEKMKSLAVIPIALGVLRAELLGMEQKRDEQFRSFFQACVERQKPANFLLPSNASVEREKSWI